jgi:hypothetical protein
VDVKHDFDSTKLLSRPALVQIRPHDPACRCVPAYTVVIVYHVLAFEGRSMVLETAREKPWVPEVSDLCPRNDRVDRRIVPDRH